MVKEMEAMVRMVVTEEMVNPVELEEMQAS